MSARLLQEFELAQTDAVGGGAGPLSAAQVRSMSRRTRRAASRVQTMCLEL